MKSKIFVFCLFFLGLTQLSAQIMYSEETLKKRYDQETILLTPREYQKNGFIRRLALMFPSQFLREDIEKNGGNIARDQYRQYRENVWWYWACTLVGLVGYVVALAAIIGATSVSPLVAVGLIAGLILVLASGFFLNRAVRHLFKAVWFHNREVLLRKE